MLTGKLWFGGMKKWYQEKKIPFKADRRFMGFMKRKRAGRRIDISSDIGPHGRWHAVSGKLQPAGHRGCTLLQYLSTKLLVAPSLRLPQTLADRLDFGTNETGRTAEPVCWGSRFGEMVGPSAYASSEVNSYIKYALRIMPTSKSS